VSRAELQCSRPDIHPVLLCDGGDPVPHRDLIRGRFPVIVVAASGEQTGIVRSANDDVHPAGGTGGEEIGQAREVQQSVATGKQEHVGIGLLKGTPPWRS
jgi:hypothetical protein